MGLMLVHTATLADDAEARPRAALGQPAGAAVPPRAEETTVTTMLGTLGRHWWAFVLRGVLAILFGIAPGFGRA